MMLRRLSLMLGMMAVVISTSNCRSLRWIGSNEARTGPRRSCMPPDLRWRHPKSVEPKEVETLLDGAEETELAALRPYAARVAAEFATLPPEWAMCIWTRSGDHYALAVDDGSRWGIRSDVLVLFRTSKSVHSEPWGDQVRVTTHYSAQPLRFVTLDLEHYRRPVRK